MMAPESHGYPPLRAYTPEIDLDEALSAGSKQLPELVVGIVRAQGADSRKQMLRRLETEFLRYGYFPYVIDIADLISQSAADLSTTNGNSSPSQWASPAKRLNGLMAWGDKLRGGIDPSVSSLMAITHISIHRPQIVEAAKERNCIGIAYIIRTLVQPAEVARLRSVYKQRFFLVGIHQGRDERLRELTQSFINNGVPESEASNEALKVIQVDEGLSTSDAGPTPSSMNVVTTFERSDVFLTVGRDHTLRRFCKQLFGYPHGAPTPPEIGMAYAYMAAKRSVSLGRSVGSSIMSKDGELLVVGHNEAAKPGGGTYSEPPTDGEADGRDHVLGSDPSDGQRITTMYSFLTALFSLPMDDLSDLLELESVQILDDEREWLESLIDLGKKLQPNLDRDIVRLLPLFSSVSGTRVMNLIEFGRSTHAEMASITEAARRGIPVKDAHMFVTTFPCHECTRNIVAAGISTLTFVQPYPKSMATHLYRDSVDFHTEPIDPAKWNIKAGKKVRFAPYEGISPTRFDELFSKVPRKYDLSEVARDRSLIEGGIRHWDIGHQPLRNSIRGYGDNDYDPLFEISRQLAEQSVIQEFDYRYREYAASIISEAGAG